ncbi:MAG: RES domain-containing protein [Nitrospirota bacterium]
MITSWRIVKKPYATHAFDGEGARASGGRWNSPGVKMVYTADSPALATLEILVQLGNPTILPSFVLISATFEESLVTRVQPHTLPAKWRSYPAPPELQRRGDEWLLSRSSAVLAVPSAVVEHHTNYLINPEHPHFPTITRSSPQPFEFDLRLLRKP